MPSPTRKDVCGFGHVVAIVVDLLLLLWRRQQQQQPFAPEPHWAVVSYWHTVRFLEGNLIPIQSDQC